MWSKVRKPFFGEQSARWWVTWEAVGRGSRMKLACSAEETWREGQRGSKQKGYRVNVCFIRLNILHKIGFCRTNSTFLKPARVDFLSSQWKCSHTRPFLQIKMGWLNILRKHWDVHVSHSWPSALRLTCQLALFHSNHNHRHRKAPYCTLCPRWWIYQDFFLLGMDDAKVMTVSCKKLAAEVQAL